jgi:hypothetical protein
LIEFEAENENKMPYSLAGCVAEAEETPPKRTTKMSAKISRFLIISLVQE